MNRCYPIIKVDLKNVLGTVDQRMFGSFAEHLGRCIYGGIYDPMSKFADDQGFRTDVLKLVKELGVSTVRYPGGNFVSGYRWEDGVGPKSERPTRYELAWHCIETNEFGTDEFVDWCAKNEIEPMLALNLGTRGMEEASEYVEYCIGTAPTTLVKKRHENGHVRAHPVKMWCLGNEMDGSWQIGHKTPEEYARIATETGRILKLINPNLELLACGSSSPEMTTFGTWERTVLKEAWEVISFLAIHRYYDPDGLDTQSYLLSAEDLDKYITDVYAIIEEIAAEKNTDNKIKIALDEWNVWYSQRDTKKTIEDDIWPKAPRIFETEYSVTDAVVVGDLLSTILKHADKVKIACLAQLVNVIAPIKTIGPFEKAIKQTIFHPFSMVSKSGANQSLFTEVLNSPTVHSEQFGERPLLHAQAVIGKKLNIFVTNRSQDKKTKILIDREAIETYQIEAIRAIFDPNNGKSDETIKTDLPFFLEHEEENKYYSFELPPSAWAQVTMAKR